MQLWLIRHAAPQVAPGTCYGSLDLAADPTATRNVAQTLAACLPPNLALHCSPLRRCAELVQALRQLRSDIDAQADARLQEMDFGQWEGQRWDALPAAELDSWTRDFAHHRPGGGESVHDFMARVAAAYADTCASGQDCAWITHAGVIRAATLLHSGVRTISRADQWPVEAPGFGEWRVLVT